MKNKLVSKNKDFTLLARDCVGGILYHQLGLRFLSPTINLYFTQKDFNYFCLYLKEYIDTELTECVDEDIEYPVGILVPVNGLKPIKVRFLHYASFDEAKKKWDERKSRINWDNIFVVSTFCYTGETQNFSQELVEQWDQIKYKKVMIVNQKYGFDNEFIINKPEDCEEYAWLLVDDINNPELKVFNKFDFVKFLNSKK